MNGGMRMRQKLLALWICSALTLISPATAALEIVDTIDIRPITSTGMGNALALAYNPVKDTLYLAQDAALYELDLSGNIINQVDLPTLFGDGAFADGMDFDETSGRLILRIFTNATTLVAELETDLVTQTKVVTDVVGSGLAVTADQLWLSDFPNDLIRQYNRDGVLVDTISVADSFPDFPGPGDLAPAGTNGLYVVDHFGRRIVEISKDGAELSAISTAALGDGRGLAIDSHSPTSRLFLQVNNDAIYVLKDTFDLGPALPLTDDARIDGDFALPALADVNFGNKTTLFVHRWHPSRSLLRFDASSILGKQVNQAVLQLYVRSLKSGGTLSISPISEDWSESSVTWNTQPVTETPFILPRITTYEEGQVVSFDVTEIARRWADGSLPDAGLMIATADAMKAVFDSKEASFGTPPTLLVSTGTSLELQVLVKNATTDSVIADQAKIPAGTPYQVTVTTNEVDCAGAFVISGPGTSGGVALLAAQGFEIGPAAGLNSVSSSILTADVTADGDTVKVSATCHGRAGGVFDSARTEFSVE